VQGVSHRVRKREEELSHSPKEFTVAERARWLAELSKALDEADALAVKLGIPHMHSPEAAELCARLAAARAQVKGLRLSRPEEVSGENGPKWSDHSIWPKRTGEAAS